MPDYIKAKALTPESFALYGTVLGRKETKPDVERPYLKNWLGLYDLGQDCEMSFGFLEMFRREMVIDQLERHMTGPEVFIPVGGVSIMPFAPASDNPDPEKIEAFILDSTQGIVINRGVWHFPPFTVTERTELLLCVPKHVSDDLDFRDVPAKLIAL